MPFNVIEITFSIHGNEGIGVTILNFPRFSRSSESFCPFFIVAVKGLAFPPLENAQ